MKLFNIQIQPFNALTISDFFCLLCQTKAIYEDSALIHDCPNQFYYTVVNEVFNWYKCNQLLNDYLRVQVRWKN